MSTLKALSMRRKSLQNIKKVTQSMKMVAASKFARAEQVMSRMKGLFKATREFFEKTKMKLDPDLPLQLIVYISSDRGLCGAAHSGIFRMLRTLLTGSKANYRVVCYGEKAKNLMRMKFGEHFIMVFTEVGKHPPIFQDASVVADKILRSGFEYQTGKIAFNRFLAKMQTEATTIPITHFKMLRDDDMMYRYQDTELDELLCFSEFLLASQLYSTMVENAAAEQCLRMTAMDGSSKSAGDMMTQLKLHYNRTRQAVITRELSEIISGASSLEKKE